MTRVCFSSQLLFSDFSHLSVPTYNFYFNSVSKHIELRSFFDSISKLILALAGRCVPHFCIFLELIYVNRPVPPLQ